jgi:hypothetical protein
VGLLLLSLLHQVQKLDTAGQFTWLHERACSVVLKSMFQTASCGLLLRDDAAIVTATTSCSTSREKKSKQWTAPFCCQVGRQEDVISLWIRPVS